MKLQQAILFELDRDPSESRFSVSVLYAVEHAVAMLRSEGISIRRVRFMEEPTAFLKQPEIASLLETEGDEAFPVLWAGGKILCQGTYPTAKQWAEWSDLQPERFPEEFSEAEISLWLSFLHNQTSSCGGSCAGCSGCGGEPALEDPLGEDWGDLD